MKIPRLTPCASGSMLAFLSVETDSDLIIYNLRLMSGRQRALGRYARQPQVDRDGAARRDPSMMRRSMPRGAACSWPDLPLFASARHLCGAQGRA